MDSVAIANIIETSHDSLDTKRNATKLLSDVKHYQQKVKSYIEGNYSDFILNLSSNEIYLMEGEKLNREVTNVLQNVASEAKNDLNLSLEELKTYIDELEEMKLGLKSSYNLLKIDKIFDKIEILKKNNEYLEITDYLDKIKQIMNNSQDKLLQNFDCYQNIKIKYQIESELLLHNLKVSFEKLIQFNEKLFQNTKSITIKITKNDKQLNHITKALFSAKYNPKKICDFLLDNVFKSIVMKPVSIEVIGTNNAENKNIISNIAEYKSETERQQIAEEAAAGIDSQYVHLFLSFSLKDLCDDLRPNYKTVFYNIEIVLKFLQFMNIQLSSNKYVFQVLFKDIMKDKLLNLIINECIMYSIPDTIDEMNESTLINDIIEFDKLLKMNSILNAEDKDLNKYAEKIEILFHNRFCNKIIDNAIDIMKKDLHDMITIVPEQQSSNPLSPSIDNSIITFSRCKISKSTNELILLMENILQQTITTSEEVSKRIMSTIPSILTHYINEAATYHEKLLKNIPQQTAIFHNNCLFLAYWLQKNYDKNIESIEQLIISLQQLGVEQLENQARSQREQLIEILHGFTLSDGISELGIIPQKVVRQCLRQLDLLKNVWQTILSDSVYFKTMCDLLNGFCLEIIKKILAVEDLPASVADGLVEICSVIIERAPTIFQDKHQVYEVKSWMKLTQLKMILNASLLEITEQWSEGKGVLAMNYTAEEVKHLIRALFQNTDHRAIALASIV